MQLGVAILVLLVGRAHGVQIPNLYMIVEAQHIRGKHIGIGEGANV